MSSFLELVSSTSNCFVSLVASMCNCVSVSVFVGTVQCPFSLQSWQNRLPAKKKNGVRRPSLAHTQPAKLDADRDTMARVSRGPGCRWADMKRAQMCRKMHPMSGHEGFKDKDNRAQRTNLEVPRRSCDHTGEERRHEAEKTEEQEGRSKRQATWAVHKVSV